MFTPILLEAHNPGPMTGRGNNTYLVVGSDGSALVDAGVGHSDHLDALEASLADRHARLTSVLVTHGHGDHVSGAAQIAARYPDAVFAKYPWPDEDLRHPVAWSPLDEGHCVMIGDEALTVLHTPGHAPDHIALWHEPSRPVFTGDLVVLGGSVMIDVARGGNLRDYLASLERLLALEPLRLFPAHGSRVDDAKAILTGCLDHRHMREKQVLTALAAGHAIVEAIAESIYDGLAPELMMAARQNVRAHLEKLKDEGRAIELNERWTL